MKDTTLGYIIIIAAATFGVAYAITFYFWLIHEVMNSEFWWTWWIVSLPLAAIVGFVVFFAIWIGLVMIRSSPKHAEELLKKVEG